MVIYKHKRYTLLKAVSLAVACLFLFNDAAFVVSPAPAVSVYSSPSYSPSSEAARATLSPPLATDPPCEIVRNPDGTYDVATNEGSIRSWNEATVASIRQDSGYLGKSFRNRWAFVDLSYLIADMLVLAREHRLQNPRTILIPLIKKHIRNRRGESEIALEGFDIDGIEELRGPGGIEGFLLSVKRDDTPAYLLTFNLDDGDTALTVRGVKVYVRVFDICGTDRPPPQGRGLFSQPLLDLIAELSREWRRVRYIHTGWPAAVNVFGSARIPVDHPDYRDAMLLGADIGHLGVPVRTGAGPSIMEAPLKGYVEARAADDIPKTEWNMTQGIRIRLPFEQKTNPYVEDNYKFNHFITRKAGLYGRSICTVIFPGGIGTDDEFFEVLSRGLPVVLFRKSFWQPIWDALTKGWEEIGALEEIGELPLITDDRREVVEFIRKAALRDTRTDPRTVEKSSQYLAQGLESLSAWPAGVVFVGGAGRTTVELKAAKEVAGRLMASGIPVRLGSRGELVEELVAIAPPNDLSCIFQATFSSSEGGPLTDTEKLLQNLIVTEHRSDHHVLLAENARAFVFLPGGVRTMNGLFDIVDMMHTKKFPRKPVVLVGSRFWQPIKDAVINAALSYSPALCNPDIADLLQVVDTPEEAMRVIANTPPAYNFRDSVKYIQAQPQARPLIIALGTDWIKGYERDLHGQFDAINPLISSIRTYCEGRGISFIVGNDGNLPGLIDAERARDGRANARVVVLAGADAARSAAFASLRDDRENAFVAGVDNHELTADSSIRLTEMLAIILRLSAGIDVSPDDTPVAVRKDDTHNIYILIPHADPMDYEQLKRFYEVQKFA